MGGTLDIIYINTYKLTKVISVENSAAGAIIGFVVANEAFSLFSFGLKLLCIL
jgi:hypothetical protein